MESTLDSFVKVAQDAVDKAHSLSLKYAILTRSKTYQDHIYSEWQQAHINYQDAKKQLTSDLELITLTQIGEIIKEIADTYAGQKALLNTGLQDDKGRSRFLVGLGKAAMIIKHYYENRGIDIKVGKIFYED